MNTPFFSIITPCRNAGDKLNRTLSSVLAQTYQDYEIIVKDAGSTDGSILDMPADRRIRLVRGEDAGIYDGMNQALPLASGEYLLFLNCGDVLHDETVLERVEREIAVRRGDLPRKGRRGAAAHGTSRAEKADAGKAPVDISAAGIFYGDVVELQTRQHVAANPHMTHLAMYRNLPCHQACFYSRDLFRERGFDLQYKVRADYEHFLWCVIQKGAPAVSMPLIVADYEGGGFSERKENEALSAKEHEEITERYFTKEELQRFRCYLLLTLQPLRKKLSQSPKTAALYDRIKNRLYGR